MKSGMIRTGVLFSFVMLLSTACEKEDRACSGNTQQSYNLTGFNKIQAGENFILNIEKGPAFSLSAEGCANDIAELNISTAAGMTVTIDYDTYRRGRKPVNLNITLPLLVAVNLSGDARATVTGFAGQSTTIRTVLSGAAECIVEGAAINANFDLSGAAKLAVSGETLSLYGNLTGSSELNSFDLSATEVDIATSGTAVARVFPQDLFIAMASGSSRIFYKGSPAQKHFDISGTAAINQQ